MPLFQVTNRRPASPAVRSEETSLNVSPSPQALSADNGGPNTQAQPFPPMRRMQPRPQPQLGPVRRFEKDRDEEWHRKEYGECARFGRLTANDSHYMNRTFAFLIAHLQRGDARVELDDLHRLLHRWSAYKGIPHQVSSNEFSRVVYRWLSSQSSLSALMDNGTGLFLCGYKLREHPLSDEQTALYVEAVSDVTWGQRR